MLSNFMNKWSIFILYSPCSGLVVSGYSKTQIDKSLNTYLAEVIEPYKNFKKMYIVDTTQQFKGKI